MIIIVVGIIVCILFIVWLVLTNPQYDRDFNEVEQRERAMQAMREWKGDGK